MTDDAQKRGLPKWTLVLSGLFAIGAAALLIGKVFYASPVDSVALLLFVAIFAPAVVPLVRRLKYKELEIEFIDGTVKQVQADLAALVNRFESGGDEDRPGVNVDPYKIRLRYASEPIDDKYFRVKVWLDGPQDFLAQVEQVTFERHPTFKNRFKVVDTAPFADTFKCWGEFTIRAVVKLKSGQTLRRQRYLKLEGADGETDQDT